MTGRNALTQKTRPVTPSQTNTVQALTRLQSWATTVAEWRGNVWQRALFFAKTWALWPLVYGVAVGVTLWSWGNAELFKVLATNKLPWEQRMQAVPKLALGIGAVMAVYVVASLMVRFRFKEWSSMAVAARLNRLLAFTLALPVVAWLWSGPVEKGDPIMTAMVCAVAAACVGVSAYAARVEPELSPKAARVVRIAAPLVLVAMGVAYAFWFSHLAINNHHALNSRTIDLGYYDNIFYQSIHGRPLGCTFVKGQNHISAHFDPLLVLMSPVYLIHPRAELLLVLQSAWLASGAIPLYLIAHRRLHSRGAGVALAFVYLAYPALHGANMYEFHSLTLITPLVLWLLFFLEEGKFIGYTVMLILLWLTREDVPLLMCFVGLYAVLDGRPRHAIAGYLTILLSVGYFVFVKKAVMPTDDFLNVGKESYGFAYYFDELIPQRKGLTELFLSLVTNPLFAFKLFFANAKKQLYLLLLFLPLAFLPFMARRRRVMLFYGLFFCLAATREPVFTVHFQYSCLIFPVAFAMTPAALSRLGELGESSYWGLHSGRLRWALLGFMLVASALLSWKFGGAIANESFRGGFARVHRTLDEKQRERYEALEQMLRQVEPGASVAVTNVLGPHVSNRERVYFYRPRVTTDYVLVWDREVQKELKTWHDARVAAGELIEIGRHENIQLYRRDPNKPVTQPTRAVPAPRPRPKTPAKPSPTQEQLDPRDMPLPEEGGELPPEP